MLVLILLGSPVAITKAKFANRLTWIGSDIEVFDQRIEVTVPKEKVGVRLAMVGELLTMNVVSIKTLRTLVGKSTHIASLIVVWPPPLNHLLAAISLDGGNAPPGCAWHNK